MEATVSAEAGPIDSPPYPKSSSCCSRLARMRTRTWVALYLTAFALTAAGMFIVKSRLQGVDYYRFVRTQHLVFMEFGMLAGSMLLFSRLTSAFINVVCPNSVGANGAYLLIPISERWGTICVTDVCRSIVALFLLLAHLSFLFYYTWVGSEPNMLAVVSLAAVGMWLHLLVFVGFGEFLHIIGATARKHCNEGLRCKLTSFVRFRDHITLWASFIALFLVLGGLHTTSSEPVVNHKQVYSKHLSSTNGAQLKIALLTDIHIGPSVGRTRIAQIVKATNMLHPDIIAISGDLADGFLVALREAAEPLCHLKAKHGVFFATGNHEYMHGNVEEWFEFLRGCNITVLHNENRVIKLNANDTLCMAGMDDLYAQKANVPGHGMDIEKALHECVPGQLQVLLAHQPNAAREVLRTYHAKYLDLILSGHTHAGQMYMFYPIVWLANAYTRGLYYDTRTDTHVLVSAGVNFFGPPVKMFGACEIIDINVSAYPPSR